MADTNSAGTQTSIASLVGGLIEDTQRLVRQEVALARREVQAEWDKTKEGASLLGGAVVLFSLVGVLFAFTLFKLLHHYVLPNHEWACFAIVTLLFAAGGGLLLYAALAKFRQVHVIPPQSMESLREDVQAVTAAVTADRTQNNNLIRR